MKTYLNERVVLAALLLFLCLSGKTQSNAGFYHKNISIMLSTKADMDCMETELLKTLKGVSLVYSNPKSGLMVIKSDYPEGTTLTEQLRASIKAKDEKISFEVIESTATYYLSHYKSL